MLLVEVCNELTTRIVGPLAHSIYPEALHYTQRHIIVDADRTVRLMVSMAWIRTSAARGYVKIGMRGHGRQRRVVLECIER